MPIPPEVRFSEWATSGADPTGSRHIDAPNPSGFVKNLSTANNAQLDFGSINNTTGKKTTITKAITARVYKFNDANEALFNLRFWLPIVTDWDQGTFFFNGFPSGVWIQGITLNDTSGQFVPLALPSGQNWWRDASGPFDPDSLDFQEITGSGVDDQVTQFFYLSVTADTNVPPGRYGGVAGGWRYRLTADFR